MSTITIVGIDAAFANMGFARVYVDIQQLKIVELESLNLVCTEAQEKKTVRKSSDDLRRARMLVEAMKEHCKVATLAIAEVPHGSQSARASWSLGIATGVLASCPIPLLEVSALEVKMASLGKKTASKDDIIEWAMKKYPHQDWLRHNGKPTKANEHLADAIAIIHAGMLTETFKMIAGHQPTSKRVKLL